MRANRFTMHLAILCLLPTHLMGLRMQRKAPKDGNTKLKVATIIAQDIRLNSFEDYNHSRFFANDTDKYEEYVKKFNQLTEGTDVFICTDQEFEPALKGFANVKRVSFQINNTEQMNEASRLGPRTVQWWRLQKCWDVVQEHERLNGIKYDFIGKLRTDCPRFGCKKYNGLSQMTDKELAVNDEQDILDEHSMFMNSDFQFAAVRNVFDRIASLYSRIESNYKNRDRDYVPLNWDLVTKCDFSAGKFHWLNYPKEVMGNKQCFDNCRQTWENRKMNPKLCGECVSQSKEELKQWSTTHSALELGKDLSKVETVTGKFFNTGLSLEKMFILDMLRSNLRIKSFDLLEKL